MKKVAIIGNVASMMLNFRGDLIRELISRGNVVYCYCTDYSVETKSKIKSLGAIPVDYSLNSKGINPFADIISTFKLYRSLKEKLIDVAFPYFVKPVLLGGVAAKIAGIPRVVGMIEGLGNGFVIDEAISFQRRIIRLVQVILYKLILRHLDALVLLNEDDKKDLIDRYRIKVRSIYVLGGIGVDLEKYKPVMVKHDVHDSMRFVFVARLLREKGIFDFISAAENVKLVRDKIDFLVLGGFDDENPFALSREEMRQYVERGVVMYPGHVDNVETWVGESDVFVLPSYYREGVPRSTQEALALAKPIITTNVPGCRETVIDGVNGYLIEPKNVNQLTQRMLMFIDNRYLIDAMGVESRRLAEAKFDVKDVNRRLIGILQL